MGGESHEAGATGSVKPASPERAAASTDTVSLASHHVRPNREVQPCSADLLWDFPFLGTEPDRFFCLDGGHNLRCLCTPENPLREYIGPGQSASRPALRLMGIIGLRASRAETGSQWTYRLLPTAPMCACGCGEQIRLKPQHRCPTKGTPCYIQGHHSTPLRRAYERFRKQGYMFLGEVCRELGISAKVHWRLEVAGKVPKAQRRKRDRGYDGAGVQEEGPGAVKSDP